MAPGALLAEPAQDLPHYISTKRINSQAPKEVFPDGIRTSGQHPPAYSKLKPYSEFPASVSGPTVWKEED